MPPTAPAPSPLPHAGTFDEATEILQTLIDWARDTGHRVGYFAALYKRINLAIQDATDGGHFEDPARMERLDVTFANRYIDAVNGYFHPGVCTPPTASWQATFDQFDNDEPILVQHLTAGINAHIGLDLGLSVDAIRRDQDLAPMRQDFLAVNAVLAGQASDLLEKVESLSPELKEFLERIPGNESKLIGPTVRLWREDAWVFASWLAKLPPIGNEIAIAARDRTTASRGEETFDGLLAVASRLFADSESRDVAHNITVLDQICSTIAPLQFTLD